MSIFIEVDALNKKRGQFQESIVIEVFPVYIASIIQSDNFLTLIERQTEVHLI